MVTKGNNGGGSGEGEREIRSVALTDTHYCI